MNWDLVDEHFVKTNERNGKYVLMKCKTCLWAFTNAEEFTMDSYYSTKLPLKTLRQMAGHNEEKQGFYCPRAAVIPNEELQQKLFPFIDDVESKIGNQAHPTLRSFLRLLNFVISIQ
jgi:uncharacterized protein (DUF1499 family)